MGGTKTKDSYFNQELAVANPDTSRFNKAHYLEELTKENFLG